MNLLQVKEFVASMLSQAVAGADIENNKFDFKRKWYDLKSHQQKAEFLKDVSSIANTFGPDGFIVIGFDDKTKEFHPARFKDSNLNDISELSAIINSSIDRIFEINCFDFDIEGHLITILHIPPSITKPHVIRAHRIFKDGVEHRVDPHRIFVRKGSGTQIASKDDLELMYYDRKNITPEYELSVVYTMPSLGFAEALVNMATALTIENSGRRPVAIKKLKLQLEFESGESILVTTREEFYKANLLIKPTEIINRSFWLYSDSRPMESRDSREINITNEYYRSQSNKVKVAGCQVNLAHGSIVECDIKMNSL